MEHRLSNQPLQIEGPHQVAFGRGRIEFRVRRTGRSTLAITVRPDTSVLVTAPKGTSLELVRERVHRRAVWVLRQQEYFSRFQPTLPPRRYVSGETHRYLGRQYRLKVRAGVEEDVGLRGRFIEVRTQRKDEAGWVRRLVEGWYLERARARFDRSLAECLGRFRGRVNAPLLLLRRMPKRWGSWTRRGVIYLNPELILAPPSCVDYVVTHELCHLVYAHHGRAFYDLLARAMPDWEQRKRRLEREGAETSLCGR